MKKISDFIVKDVIKIGDEPCGTCNVMKPIFEKDGKRVSHCLNCENERLKKEMMQLYNNRKKKAINRLIDKYQILPYRNPVTFDDYNPTTELQKRAKEITMNFLELEETTLFFQGNPGLGKTHLSFCLARELKEQGKHVLFVDTPGLMSTLRNSYNRNSEFNQEELMRLIDDVDLFVLDDVGAEYVRSDDGMESWVSDILYQIVNTRQGKRNVYTTNYSGKELRKKYGAMSSRIISRMMANSKIIKLDGNDHRLKGLN